MRSHLRRKAALALWCVGATFGAFGCDGQANGSAPGAAGRAGASGTDGGQAAGSAGVPGDGKPPRPEASAAPRTILQRSPFGNVEPGNFVMNGDFELGIGAVVPGWYAIADDHVMSFRYRTGGACRSGLLCAEIASGQSLVATMVSLPPSGPVTITAYTKPRSGRAVDVTVRLTLQAISGESLGVVPLQVVDVDADSGFVRQRAVFDVDRPYDLVTLVVDARDSTLVDDVSVRAGAPPPGLPFTWPRGQRIPASVGRAVRVAREEARGQRFSPEPRPATVAPPVALPHR